MNIYIISQDVNDEECYYDSAVVYANSEEEARLIYPEHPTFIAENDVWIDRTFPEYDNIEVEYDEWSNHPSEVNVQLIGISTDTEISEPGTIMASYNGENNY